MKKITIDYDDYVDELRLNIRVGREDAIKEVNDYLRHEIDQEQFLDSCGTIANRKRFLDSLDFYYEKRRRKEDL